MAQGGVRIGLLAALALAACGGPSPPLAPTPSPQPPARPAAPPREAPPSAAAPHAAATPGPSAGSDSCGAAALQYLVGKPRTDIPVPLTPSRRRVICSTCMATQEFVPYRQTITYDSNTGLVTSVKCG